MQWQKAGRPSKQVEKKPEWLEQEWTKEEQSIITATERAHISMLAVMVVRQWVRDGKPKSDYEGIKPWLQIIEDSITAENEKAKLPEVGELYD